MKDSIGHTGVSHEDLQLYFDGELTGAEAQELAAQIEAEPDLRGELEQLGVLKALVTGTLEVAAEAVPQARFEQVWDEIDRAIDRETRSRGAVSTPSLWTRVWVALRPVRWPALVAGAAAAVAVVWTGMGPGDGPNKADQVASVFAPTLGELPQMPKPDMSDGAIAEADPPVVFEDPKAVPTEIESVDINVKNGRIGNAGTVTVLYLEEDEPEDSERSL